MANLNDVIKINEADYEKIVNAYPSSTTISTGATVTFDPNSIYLVQEVTDSLLWMNPYPTQNYVGNSSETLSQSVANFEYLIFEYKEGKNDATSTFKVIRTPTYYASSTSSSSDVAIRLNMIYMNVANPTGNAISYSARACFVTSATTVYFTRAVSESGNTDNVSYYTDEDIIPIAIYGSNKI